MMNVMVLGGYGNFGARISRALSDDDRIQLLVAGRDAQQAAAFAAALPGRAKGVVVDMHSASFAQALQDHGVGLLIHTAGPFQGQDYAVARACAQAGVHYIDLADGRRFVCDFPRALNAAFVDAGRVAISGASTVPALSSAVVDSLCAGWQRLDTLDICIAPAQTAPRGVATLRAVLSYCGGPIQVWHGGQWQTHIGWAKPKRVAFQRLRPRLGALCDIPDLELFPAHYQVRERMEFRAALEVGLAQRAFAVPAFSTPPPKCLTPWGRHWAAWWCVWRGSMLLATPPNAHGTSPPTMTMAQRSPVWPQSCWHGDSPAANPWPAVRMLVWA